MRTAISVSLLALACTAAVAQGKPIGDLSTEAQGYRDCMKRLAPEYWPNPIDPARDIVDAMDARCDQEKWRIRGALGAMLKRDANAPEMVQPLKEYMDAIKLDFVSDFLRSRRGTQLPVTR